MLECYDFLTAIRDGRAPEVDGTTGMKAKAIAEAIYESAATGPSGQDGGRAFRSGPELSARDRRALAAVSALFHVKREEMRMRTLSCPRCSEPMVAQTVLAGATAVLVDTCAPSCAGIWLDSQDIETGLDVTDDLQQVTLTRAASLPDCRPADSLPRSAASAMQRYRLELYLAGHVGPVRRRPWDLDRRRRGQEMEAFEEHEVLPAERQVQLRARLGMDRLELAADHLRPVERAATRCSTGRPDLQPVPLTSVRQGSESAPEVAEIRSSRRGNAGGGTNR